MKQLLFLLLLPCLAMAQYTGNGNQKITLGEQTTADGLVFRGVLNDTAIITPFSDTSAYIILDTVNNRFYNYNRATNVWSVAGGTITLTTTGTSGAATFSANTLNIPNYGSALSGYLALTGGTLTGALIGTTGSFRNDAASIVMNLRRIGTSGVRLQLENIGTDAYGIGMPANTGDLVFYSSNVTERFRLSSTGAATFSSLAGINDVGADANGKLQAATSDMNLKNTIEDSPFGLNELLLLNPVTFLYNDANRKIDSDVKEVGFIAQDVFDIIPNAVSSTGTGDLQLDYRAITATLVKAIQEQQALIKALEQRILILENK